MPKPIKHISTESTRAFDDAVLKGINRRQKKHGGGKMKRDSWNWWAFGLGVVIVLCATVLGVVVGRVYQKSHDPVPVVIHIIDPKTGEWKTLDTRNRPVIGLFCGDPTGGAACRVIRIEDGMQDESGKFSGVLLMPWIPAEHPSSPTPPTTTIPNHTQGGISEVQHL